jgi:hypothetical protein
MTTRKFWPLDFDPEGEVYENVAWDLPGYNRASARAEDSIHPFAPAATALKQTGVRKPYTRKIFPT